MLNQALELYQSAGYAPGIFRCFNNLSFAHYNLGLYRRALRLITKGEAIARRAGSFSALAFALTNRVNIEIAFRRSEVAEQLFSEFADLVPKLGGLSVGSAVYVLPGRLALLKHDLPLAITSM